MDGVRLVRSEAPRCHPKDPLRPSKHEQRVPANDARHTKAGSLSRTFSRDHLTNLPGSSRRPAGQGGFAPAASFCLRFCWRFFAPGGASAPNKAELFHDGASDLSLTVAPPDTPFLPAARLPFLLLANCPASPPPGGFQLLGQTSRLKLDECGWRMTVLKLTQLFNSHHKRHERFPSSQARRAPPAATRRTGITDRRVPNSVTRAKVVAETPGR